MCVGVGKYYMCVGVYYVCVWGCVLGVGVGVYYVCGCGCVLCVWVWVVCHGTGSTGSLDHSSPQTSKTVELDG